MISLWQNFTRSWSQHFIMQLATLTVLTASFTVVTCFFALSLNFKRILAQWNHEVQVTAYLKEDVSSSDIKEIEAQIKKMDDVDHVEFVSQHEAVQKFSKQLATYAPNLLSDGGFESAFPASFQIYFGASVSSQMDRLIALSDKIGRFVGVEDVTYGQGWIENYAHFVRGLASLGWVLTAILVIGALFVVGNSIRTSISQRRDEIEILELIGATAGMIRKPYLFEGAVMGGLAMSLSLAINYGFYVAQVHFLETSWGFMGLADKISFPGVLISTALIGFGAMVGVFGSYVTLHQLNDGWSASQRVSA